MQNPFQSIFGGNTGATVESLKKRREIADLLAQQATGGEYRNWGDGVGMIAKALGARMMDKSVSAQEDTARKSAMDQFLKIQGGLGDEGISMADFQGLSDLRENPYAPSGIQGVAQSLMRRQVQPGMPPIQGGTGSDALMGQAAGDQFQGTAGGPMGWTDPAEMPPEGDIETLQRQFDASPTDMNGMLLDQAKRQQQGLPPPANPGDIMGGMQGMGGPMSGAGGMLASVPQGGPQMAQADTGTQSDAGTSMKLTEQQSKNLNFWNRMDATSSDIDKFAPALMDRGERIKDGVPMFGNSLVSEDYQRGRRAGGEWLVSILRPDTGATVTDTEWDTYAPIYLPEPGDGPNQLADKTAARARAAEGLKKGLGLAEVMANELKAARQSATPAAAASGDDWRNADPSTWTDEQLREFTQ